jgi:hypothetical protein
LLLKIGIRLSPRTVAKYMPKPGARPWNDIGSQSWRTFLQNHPKQIVACDFFTVVTASLKVLYVFVVMEHASRRISHFNVTDHPRRPVGRHSSSEKHFRRSMNIGFSFMTEIPSTQPN